MHRNPRVTGILTGKEASRRRAECEHAALAADIQRLAGRWAVHLHQAGVYLTADRWRQSNVWHCDIVPFPTTSCRITAWPVQAT